MDTSQAQSQQAPPPGPVKRLTLSSQDRVIGGVAGGLGSYFGIDPVIFRVGFVALAIAGGSGVLLYLVGWILLDDDRASDPNAAGPTRRHANPTPVLAAVLLGIGSVVLLGNLPFMGDGDLLWPVLLLAAGAYLWFRKPELHVPPAPQPPPPVPTGPPAAEAAPPPLTEPPAPLWEPAPPPPAGPQVHSITWPVISLLLIVAGAAALLETTGAIETSVESTLAVLLTITGLALLTTAWIGRGHGLVLVALVLGAAVATTSTIDVPLRGGIGDRSWTPLSPAEANRPFRLGIGEAILDLRQLELGEGRVQHVEASVGVGHLVVVLPASLAATIDARADVGETVVFGNRDSGTDARMRVSDGDTDAELDDILDVDVRVGVGQVEVRRVAA